MPTFSPSLPMRLVLWREQPTPSIIEPMLALAGIRSEYVATPADLLGRLWDQQAALVVLEISGDPQPSLQLCQLVRRFFIQPILVAEHDLNEAARIALLDAGADDIVRLPRGLAELSPRCKMLLRRLQRQLERDPDSAFLCGDGLRLDIAGRRLWFPDGTSCDLSAGLTRLLAVLLAAHGAIISPEELSLHLFGADALRHSRRIGALVRSLEQRLGGYGPLIEHIRGQGYRLGE